MNDETGTYVKRDRKLSALSSKSERKCLSHRVAKPPINLILCDDFALVCKHMLAKSALMAAALRANKNNHQLIE